jgi:hypothetical protein
MFRRIAVSVEKMAGMSHRSVEPAQRDDLHKIVLRTVTNPSEEANLQPDMRHISEEIDRA